MAGTKDRVEGLPGFGCQSILTTDAGGLINSLQGIDSSTLQDGALCYVRDTDAVYRFYDTSTAVHDGVTIVRPSDLTAGQAGRWLLIEGGAVTNSRTAGYAQFLAVDGVALTGPFAAGTFGTLDPANFTAGPDNSADLTVTPLAGRITYNGLTTKLVTVSVGVSVELAAADRLTIAVFHQGVLIATSQQQHDYQAGAAATEVTQLVSEIVLELAPGEAVQIRIAETTGGTAATLYSAYISVTD
jgi:hypothetical protein